MAAISLWRKGGRSATGHYQARWKEGRKRVAWNTRTSDHAEAQRRAAAELERRHLPTTLSPPEAEPKAVPPLEPSAPANGTNGHRRPLSDVLARALEQGEPLPTSFATPPPAPAETGRRLHEVFGEVMGYVTEGALKRAVRYAGREPDEMDDDELEQVRAGWAELGEQWFGSTNLGPWGKIAIYSTVAGVGMYRNGKPLPPPEPLPPREPEPAGGGDGD